MERQELICLKQTELECSTPVPSKLCPTNRSHVHAEPIIAINERNTSSCYRSMRSITLLCDSGHDASNNATGEGLMAPIFQVQKRNTAPTDSLTLLLPLTPLTL